MSHSVPWYCIFGEGIPIGSILKGLSRHTLLTQSQTLYTRCHTSAPMHLNSGAMSIYLPRRQGKELSAEAKGSEHGIVEMARNLKSQIHYHPAVRLRAGHISSLFPHLWEGEDSISWKHCWGEWRSREIYSSLSLFPSLAGSTWEMLPCTDHLLGARHLLAHHHIWKCFHKCLWKIGTQGRMSLWHSILTHLKPTVAVVCETVIWHVAHLCILWYLPLEMEELPSSLSFIPSPTLLPVASLSVSSLCSWPLNPLK